MCVKANSINSVVLLTVPKYISHTNREKQAFGIILNECIFDMMCSTQHLAVENFECCLYTVYINTVWINDE